mgnify:CR=1 FL=1
MSSAPLSATSLVRSALADGLRPEGRLGLAEWSDRYRVLGATASGEPGLWRTSRMPYLREIMDNLSSDSPVVETVLMKGTQLGGTECANNLVGYTIHHDPGPIMCVLPSLDLARKVSAQRLAPMIEETPVLRGRVADVKSRSGRNTMLVKTFDGGFLVLAGANSAIGLRSMPIRKITFDEVDEFPRDVAGQGDPVDLAKRRASNFRRKKFLHISSPTIRGLSRIEASYLAGDQRRYFVPCPHCGHFDFLTWNGRDWLHASTGAHFRIVWDEGNPDSARAVCPACDGEIAETHKPAMLERGEWRPTATHRTKVRSYHLSSLYSPLGWMSWAECVEVFLEVGENVDKLKTWVNTILAETFEERGTTIDAETLRGRANAEHYDGEVPDGVGALVASVDVQDDRLELLVNGFGEGEESWLIAFAVLPGDPSTPDVWFELDRYLAMPFTHRSGRRMPLSAVTVDTGGHRTDEAYRYVKGREGRRVYAIKGGTMRGRPLVSRPSRGNRYKVPLYTLCVDTGKEAIMARLAITRPGPGFMHFPPEIDDEFLRQLTSEKAIRKLVRGKGVVRVWEQLRPRNEAIDLEVYALAALKIKGEAFIRSLGRRAAFYSRPVPKAAEPAAVAGDPKPRQQEPKGATPGAVQRRPRKAGWAKRW